MLDLHLKLNSPALSMRLSRYFAFLSFRFPSSWTPSSELDVFGLSEVGAGGVYGISAPLDP